jgi:hypothetical protein
MTYGPEYAVALYGRGLVRHERGHPGGAADIEQARRLLPKVAELADFVRD